MITGITEDSGNSPITAQVLTQVVKLDRKLLAKIKPEVVTKHNHPAATLQVEWERTEALTEIRQASHNLSPIPTDIANKIAALGSVNDVAKIRALKAEIKHDIKQAIAADNLDKSINLSGLMQNAEYQALWADFHKGEKEIQDEFEKLYAAGKIKLEQMQYLRKERERLDNLAEDSEERLIGEQQFAGYQKELGIQVRDAAHKAGEVETEKSATAAVHGAEEQEHRLKAMYKLHDEGQKEKETKITTANTDMHMSDEDELTAISNLEKGKQGKESYEVTYNDIQMPFGGKDRSSGRIIVKT